MSKENPSECVCGSCGRVLFFGVVEGDFDIRCDRCSWVMRLRATVVPSLAEAIVESLKSAPTVTTEGKTVCNCGDCRIARN